MRIKRGDGLRSSLFESILCIVIVGFVIFGQWIFDIKDICRCVIVDLRLDSWRFVLDLCKVVNVVDYCDFV